MLISLFSHFRLSPSPFCIKTHGQVSRDQEVILDAEGSLSASCSSSVLTVHKVGGRVTQKVDLLTSRRAYWIQKDILKLTIIIGIPTRANRLSFRPPPLFVLSCRLATTATCCCERNPFRRRIYDITKVFCLCEFDSRRKEASDDRALKYLHLMEEEKSEIERRRWSRKDFFAKLFYDA